MTTPKVIWPAALALAFLAVGLFWGAIGSEFIWDDQIILTQQLPHLDRLSEILFPPRELTEIQGAYYRPVVMASFVLDEKLSGLFWPPEEREAGRRVVFHASCVLFHALATALVFLLTWSLLGPRRDPSDIAAAGAAGLLFAVHPIHVEAVAWMAGRSDLLAGLFFLLALWTYEGFLRRERRWLWWLSATFGLLAMLSKEMGVAVLLAIPALDFFWGEARTAGLTRWKRIFPFALAALVYFGLRSVAIQGVSGLAWPAIPELVLGVFRALGWYFRKAVWPPPQSAFVEQVPGGSSALLGAAVPAVAAGLVVLAWKRRSWRPEALGALLFLFPLLPALPTAVLPIAVTPLAERYLYLPTAGLCLILASLLQRAALAGPWSDREWRRPAAVMLAAGVLAVPAAVTSLQRAAVWRENVSFWQAAAAQAPRSAIVQQHYGNALAAAGRVNEAVDVFREALPLLPDARSRASLTNNIGSALLDLNRPAEAIGYFRQAVLAAPDYPVAHFNWALAELTLAKGEKDPAAQAVRRGQALDLLSRTLQLDPAHLKARFYAGMELLRAGRAAEGRAQLQHIQDTAPRSEQAARARALLQQSAGVGNALPAPQ